MLGVDIVLISRFEESFDKMVERLLTKDEKKQLELRKNHLGQVEYLAGRFASKEAFVKATGNKSVSYQDLSIIDDDLGKPHFFFKGEERGEISISHDGYAIAVYLDKQ